MNSRLCTILGIGLPRFAFGHRRDVVACRAVVQQLMTGIAEALEDLQALAIGL
jgi:hypothetical protein